MFGHHVQSKCEIGWTYSKFGRTMSDDRLLFPALVCSVCDDYEQYIPEGVQLATNTDSVSCLFPEVNPCWMEFITGWLTIWEKPCIMYIPEEVRLVQWSSHRSLLFLKYYVLPSIKFSIKVTFLLTPGEH